MNGIPNICSTKADYEFIKDQAIEGWQTKWRDLLEGRFVTDGDDLVDDLNAPIFRLGFSVEEVSSAIEFSGLTNREVEWRESQPDRWKLEDGEWIEIEGWLEARTAIKLLESKAKKIAEIQTEKCRLRDSGIVLDGVLFDTDTTADTKYTKMLLACQINPSYEIPDWKASDGVFVTMTGALVLQVMLESGARESILTSKQKEKIAEVNALKTVEEVESYNVTLNWGI